MTSPILFRRTLASWLLAAGALLSTGMARADDLDIYIDPTPLPAQAPLTALAIDLNLTSDRVLCDNVLLSNAGSCDDIRKKLTVQDLLTYLGSPTIPAIPGLDPNALLSQTSGTVLTLLSGALGATSALSLTDDITYYLAIQQILTSLTDSRLTIIFNHANRGPLNGTVAGVCAFADQSSLPGARQDTLACSNGSYLFTGLTNLADPVALLALLGRVRQALIGDPVAVNTSSGSGSTSASVAVGQPTLTVPRAFSAAHPYQAKEIYAELAKYLRGDPVFNGHLGIYDYGDENPANNLDASFPLLSWDRTAETTDGKSYKSGLATYPLACNINLVHIQATNARGQDDSDKDLKALFPEGDSDRNGTLTLPELVGSAADSGFVFGTDDRRRIQSRFVVQENLFTNGDLSELDKINKLGNNVSTYSDVLGLLGRGKSIAGSLIKPLSVDTSLTSLTIAASRSTATGILQAAYLPVFRADPDQRPAWPGNLKRLQLRARTGGTAPQKDLYDVVDARDDANQTVNPALTADGRIRSTALTIWTDATKLGTGISSDGTVADLGGAGQKIPGYQFNGGGNPGRANGTGVRKIYYDSQPAGGVLCGDLSGICNGRSTAGGALNPDDSGVRAELVAATGATAVTLPDLNCSTNCQTARDTRDAACGNPTNSSLICATNNTTCLAACSTADYTNVCNSEQATCNAACPTALGLARTTCLASCTTARTACPATKITQCNQSCATTLSQCPAAQQASCLTDSAAQYSSCRLACTITRSADTITRELLLYARGFDVGTRSSPLGNGPSDSPTNSGVTGRKWMLGAVLHSRPVAINYGRLNGDNNDEVVRVVYGSADGMLHMVDDATGNELWGFMPQAVMGSLSTLRENQTGSALPYGVDGSPVVLIRDRAPTSGTNAGRLGIIGDVQSMPAQGATAAVEGDRVLLFFGLRRGGAAYYALDVTDANQPKLVWRLTTAGLQRAGSSTVETGTSTLYSSMGLAFSTPQVGRIRVDLDEANVNASADVNTDLKTHTVLIFGGGYNGGRNGAGTKVGKDLNNSRATTPVSNVGQDDGSATVTDRGNALFMIDAADGTLLWRAVRSTTAAAIPATPSNRTYAHPLMADSIASDVTAVDTNNDGLTDRVYVGDTGGRLWRADFPGVLASGWTITPVASVGRHNRDNKIPAATVADDRRIFFAPDYVPLRNTLNNQGSDIVLFGTGDREDVLNLTTPNWFYGYRDQDTVSGKAVSEILLTESSIPQHSSFDDVSGARLTDISGLTTGYRFAYTRTGEKHFSAPVTLDGTVTFTSYIPPDPSVPTARVCTPSEGVSRLYSIGVRKSEFRGINNATSAGRDVPLANGLPGEINVLSSTNQAAGGQVYSIKAKESYRASWRERLGETQK